jgi:hypothetical protein
MFVFTDVHHLRMGISTREYLISLFQILVRQQVLSPNCVQQKALLFEELEQLLVGVVELLDLLLFLHLVSELWSYIELFLGEVVNQLEEFAAISIDHMLWKRNQVSVGQHAVDPVADERTGAFQLIKGDSLVAQIHFNVSSHGVVRVLAMAGCAVLV